MAIFPGEPGLDNFIVVTWMTEVVVTTADVSRAKLNVTTNKPSINFLQAGWPSCCPTNSVKALKGK